MKTHKQHLDKECTHQEYYAQFVTPNVTAVVLSGIGKKRLLASTDPHYNDIPLSKWDRLGMQIRAEVTPLLKQADDFYSQASMVCILKAAARQIVGKRDLPTYCIPGEAGLASTASAVGRRIGKMLDAVETIRASVMTGGIVADAERFKHQVIDQLRAEGWRISVNARDHWQVLPPKEEQ